MLKLYDPGFIPAAKTFFNDPNMAILFFMVLIVAVMAFGQKRILQAMRYGAVALGISCLRGTFPVLLPLFLAAIAIGSAIFFVKMSLELRSVHKGKKVNNKIKTIIYDGVVDCVLAGGALAENPPEIEIVDVNRDYEDYEALDAHAGNLRRDDRLHGIPFTVADFKQYNDTVTETES